MTEGVAEQKPGLKWLAQKCFFLSLFFLYENRKKKRFENIQNVAQLFKYLCVHFHPFLFSLTQFIFYFS